MRYPGGGLTAAEQARRERVRLAVAELIEADALDPEDEAVRAMLIVCNAQTGRTSDAHALHARFPARAVKPDAARSEAEPERGSRPTSP